ncbi:MAG TPA: Lrp/AsnC ligand binding domain-containing protein [Myxococcota bacterium]|jgi:DNA-binding Lrp family transcriptional regulator|nr:Lrp/AsnC family transcriptional regulator [Oligoflexales bacterium]HQL57199.1 Lrp/AsnC ligand binding domain-containing protein [Myxococcota bacterium]
MTASAYVLIEAASGKISHIIEEMQKIPEVTTCDVVTGQFDIIARVEAEDMNVLARVSYAKIQLIDGVLRTTTCSIVRMG